MMQPDIEQARRFLSALAGDEPVVFQCFDDSEEKRPGLARVMPGTLGKWRETLSALNSRGAGIFVTVNATNGARKTENITKVRAVFVDLDGSPLGPVKDCPVRPHIIVESSHGKYHAYWLTTDVNLDEFSPIQRTLAAKFAGDTSVHDLPRVMRLPGFLHKKGEPFQTRIIEAHEAPPYTKEQIVSGLGLKIAETPPPATPINDAQPGEKIPQGQRHRNMATVIARLRNAGLSGVRLWEAAQKENQARCTPPLPDPELRKLVEWAQKKDSAPSVPQVVRPSVVSFADLNRLEIPEVKWIVSDLLPAGLTILAGSPKVGKSWWVQQLSIAVANGQRFMGKFRTEQGAVLHLPLEDTPARFRKRMNMLLDGATPPDSAYFANAWPRFSDNEKTPGGLDYIAEWLEQHHTDARLVVVDTFERVRPRQPFSRENIYSRQYNEILGLQTMAGRYGVAVILVMHRNKGEHSDTYNTITGSVALTGGADTVAIMDRDDRTQADATLFVSGRDVEGVRGALKFDRRTGGWIWLGDAVELKLTRERQEIRAVLKTEGRAMRPADIAKVLTPPKEPAAVQRLLSKMLETGEIERAVGQYGRYVVAAEDARYGKPMGRGDAILDSI